MWLCSAQHRLYHDGSRVSLSSYLAKPQTDSPCLSRSVTSVDMDDDALELAKENVEEVEMEEHIELIRAEIGSKGAIPSLEGVPIFDPSSVERPDTVVMK